MVHVHNTVSSPKYVFGMLDQGQNYYIYVYLPEHAVFETTPRKVFYYMFGYICLLLISRCCAGGLTRATRKPS